MTAPDVFAASKIFQHQMLHPTSGGPSFTLMQIIRADSGMQKTNAPCAEMHILLPDICTCKDSNAHLLQQVLLICARILRTVPACLFTSTFGEPVNDM